MKQRWFNHTHLTWNVGNNQWTIVKCFLFNHARLQTYFKNRIKQMRLWVPWGFIFSKPKVKVYIIWQVLWRIAKMSYLKSNHPKENQHMKPRRVFFRIGEPRSLLDTPSENKDHEEISQSSCLLTNPKKKKLLSISVRLIFFAISTLRDVRKNI